MKSTLTLITLLVFALKLLPAQTIIEGSVADPKGQPIIGANISIKGSYDGTSSDAKGNFNFATTETDSQILIITYIGYEDWQQKIPLNGKPVELKLVLKQKINDILHIKKKFLPHQFFIMTYKQK